MTDEPFDLQSHVDGLYDNRSRRFAMRAESVEEFEAWKQELRGETLKLLGLVGRTAPPVHAEQIHAEDRGSYTEEKYSLDVGEGVRAPTYMLVPKQGGPFKPVLVFHGHNPSIQPILGNFADDEAAEASRAKDGNYAQALAEAGYLVCGVEQRGFGERLSRQRGSGDVGRSCRHLAFEYMMNGRTLIGERVWDGMRAIDFLQTRDDIVADTLGCTGNSGGGTTSLWLSAMEERITVSVPSCYFCSFKRSIMDIIHCECNYVPGIVQLAEMGDLAALVAPRPFRAIAGEQDQIFPVQAVRDEFETVKRAYGLLGAEDRCSLAIHPGPHAYNRAMSHEWFGKWL